MSIPENMSSEPSNLPEEKKSPILLILIFLLILGIAGGIYFFMSSSSEDVPDSVEDLVDSEVTEIPEDIEDKEEAEDEVLNFYIANLPDYANLEVVEKWQFEADLSTDYDGAGGNIKGAVDVQSFNGEDYLHVRGAVKDQAKVPENGVFEEDTTILRDVTTSILDADAAPAMDEGPGGADPGSNTKSRDSINTWIFNDDLVWEFFKVSVEEEGLVHSHPFGITGPDGNFHMFFQTSPEDTNDELWISKAVSEDGINFSDPEKVLEIEDYESFEAYDCGQAAHGRVEQLPDGNYLIAFSASCQRDKFDLASSFMAGMLIAYSEDLETFEVEDLSYFPACNDPTIDSSQGKVYLYCDLTAFVDGDWDDSQYTRNQGLRLIVRYDSDDGYNFDPANPAGLVYFYDENGDWVSIEEYKIDDIDIHTSSYDGIVRLYTTAEVGDGPTIYSFVRMD